MGWRQRDTPDLPGFTSRLLQASGSLLSHITRDTFD